MPSFSGSVDSHPTYYPIDILGKNDPVPEIPDYGATTLDGGKWMEIDSSIEDDDNHRFSWNPSVCTSDEVEADTISEASELLLRKHHFPWPSTIGAWRLVYVGHETIMDESEPTTETEN